MNKNRLSWTTFAIFLLVGSVGYAQESDSVPACKILDSQATDSDSSSDNSEQSLDDQNRILPTSSQSTSSLSTSPPAEYRTPESLWSIGKDTTDNPAASFKPYTWESPNVTHRNLLFDEPLLERHGFHRGEFFQPVISGTRFFWQAAILPIDIIRKKHRCCDSALGWGAPSVNDCDNCQR